MNLQELLKKFSGICLRRKKIRGKRAQVLLRIDDEAVLIFLGELSGSADDLIDSRLGPISVRHSGWSRAAADCIRDVMAITKMGFLQRRRAWPRWLESLRRDSV